MSLRIGVDLGGTKIEIAVLDERNRTLLRRREPTPAGDYAAIVERVAALVEQVETETGSRCPVGVGTPGAVSPVSGVMKNANSIALIGKHFREDLERRLGRTIRTSNDANCFTLSEATDGAAAGCEVVFGIILGTGVGGGIAVRGRIVEGPNAIAGEWGHNPLPWPRTGELPGPECYCGKRGCIETFLCGPALTRDHREACGETLAPTEIAAKAQAGDRCCADSIARYIDRLARGLAGVVNILDPDAVAIGGGVSNVRQIFASLPQALERYVFSDAVRTRIVAPAHGDSSGVRGAAMLWP